MLANSQTVARKQQMVARARWRSRRRDGHPSLPPEPWLPSDAEMGGYNGLLQVCCSYHEQISAHWLHFHVARAGLPVPQGSGRSKALIS